MHSFFVWHRANHRIFADYGNQWHYTSCAKKFKLDFIAEVSMSRRVVVYMSPWCYNSQDTQRALTEWNVSATFINIKEDRAAATRLKSWVGYESVPTVIVAEADSLEPAEQPAPLKPGNSPRGIDRGSLITEANRGQLRDWLVKHGFVAA